MFQIANKWKDYELIDAGNEEKLERWGKYILRRPDPQAIWEKNSKVNWNNVDMFYHRSNKGGGYWENKGKVPDSWNISYKDLKFKIKPTAFKHTGIFPEQASNWEWLVNKIKSSDNVKVLNLFAYTGGATIACASAGALVCHVDASKGMVQVAKENINLSNLNNSKVRFIVDDVKKFVTREIRRGNKYEGIIMDPPVYGRGPTGELWEIEKNLVQLVNLCSQLLSENRLFFLINAYATNFSATSLENILRTTFNQSDARFESGENCLLISNRNLILPCGLFARAEFS